MVREKSKFVSAAVFGLVLGSLWCSTTKASAQTNPFVPPTAPSGLPTPKPVIPYPLNPDGSFDPLPGIEQMGWWDDFKRAGCAGKCSLAYYACLYLQNPNGPKDLSTGCSCGVPNCERQYNSCLANCS